MSDHDEDTSESIEERKKRLSRIFFGFIRPKDIEDFTNFLVSDELHGEEIMETYRVRDPRYQEYLDLLIESGEYRNCTLLRIMQNQKILDVVDYIGIERFSIFINRDGYDFEAEDSDRYWNNTFRYMQSVRGAIHAINQTSIEKLRVIFSDISRDKKTFSALVNPNFFYIAMNDLDIDKIRFLYLTEGIREPCTDAVDELNRISMGKLDVLLQYFSYEWRPLLKFLKEPHCVQNINDMNAEKFIFLTGSDYFRARSLRLLALAQGRNQLNLVNSIGIEDLKIIFSVIRDFDLSLVLNSTTKYDKRSLSFAVALYKKGVISNITFDYVRNNNNALFNDVIAAFPKSFPIERVLEVPAAPGLVPKLLDRCIQVVLEKF